jgi:multiple sugar transport system permease protein
MKERGFLDIKRYVIHFIMIFLALLAIVPLFLMLINATRTTEQVAMGLSIIPGGNTMNNWRTLTGRGFHIWQGFSNSAFIAISTTVLSVYFSAMTAYGLHMYRFRGRLAIWTVILIIMMLPGTLTFIGFYQFMVRLKLVNNYIPLIIPSIAAAATVLFLRQYMMSIGSMREFVDAGRIDGANEFIIFNRLILPITIPALAAQAIFTFVNSWNNFITPFILISSKEKYTLPMLVQSLRGDIYRVETGAIYLGIAVSIIPIIIFFAFMARFIISGLTMGSIKE